MKNYVKILLAFVGVIVIFALGIIAYDEIHTPDMTVAPPSPSQTVTSDYNHLIYQTQSGINIANTSLSTVLIDQPIQTFAVNVDKQKIYFVYGQNQTSTIYTCSLSVTACKEPTILTTISNATAIDFSLSPTGQYLAYLVENGTSGSGCIRQIAVYDLVQGKSMDLNQPTCSADLTSVNNWVSNTQFLYQTLANNNNDEYVFDMTNPSSTIGSTIYGMSVQASSSISIAPLFFFDGKMFTSFSKYTTTVPPVTAFGYSADADHVSEASLTNLFNQTVTNDSGTNLNARLQPFVVDGKIYFLGCTTTLCDLYSYTNSSTDAGLITPVAHTTAFTSAALTSAIKSGIIKASATLSNGFTAVFFYADESQQTALSFSISYLIDAAGHSYPTVNNSLSQAIAF